MDAKNHSSTKLPPLLFPGKTPSERRRITSLVQRGLIRPIAPRIYASVPEGEVSNAVRIGWAEIVAHLYPNAVISHRTAFDFKPTASGEVFLTAKKTRTVHVHDLLLKFSEGPAVDEEDNAFMGAKISSFERALLESLEAAKGSLQSRAFTLGEIEQRLEREMAAKGERRMNEIRDRARAIAGRLKKEKACARLEAIIGGLLGTRVVAFASDAARARSIGRPYDLGCFKKLQILFSEIKASPSLQHDEFKSAAHISNKAFFESYFSNYIEGTVFKISEAESIVFEKQIPESRPRDAHDILDTYRIVSDMSEMRITPQTPNDLLAILKRRHSSMFAVREDVQPGKFKEIANRAGSTEFVPPDLVEGTLAKGFEMYESLETGLQRAMFVMFLISEVHPFNDGNGRIARVMMNAELGSQGKSSIIVPNVYREDYLLALRALSRQERAAPFVRMMEKAHNFSHLDFERYPEIKQTLTDCFWFEEPSAAKIRHPTGTQKVEHKV